MPTFDQAAFLPRAVGSLHAQTLEDWELVVVDDGSRDATADAVERYAGDVRIRSVRLPDNRGLGAACNVGLDLARADVVAYLPSDDRYDADHLERLLAALDGGAILAASGMRHSGRQTSLRCAPGVPLQLVQVAHRRTPDRWVERPQLETDDLDRLLWGALRGRGDVAWTDTVTCEWVSHPAQRHKAIRESFDGGLNVFRRRYRIAEPLRFWSSDSWPVDEVALYRRFREEPLSAPAADGLTILLVGELAYNPERVLAFAERGHRLYGLWTDDALGPSTVGPMPFGHVADLPTTGWRDAIAALQPDVVYALLNWRAIPLAHAVLTAGLGVPFVWHVKESPHLSISSGTWPLLVDLHTRSDAQVYSTEEERAWFDLALPGRLDPARSMVLDGDLPKSDWFTDDRRARLSERDGEAHLVALGRPLGLDAEVVVGLAHRGVHTHLYGQVRAPGPKGAWQDWIADAMRRAPSYVHTHPHVDQRSWVRELSAFDGGWLHLVRSDNGGDLRRATWDDLNHAARIPPLMAAGVPLVHPASHGSTTASGRLIEETGAGVVFDDLDDLAGALTDERAMQRRRCAAWSRRHEFTFDAHVDRLVDLFRTVTVG